MPRSRATRRAWASSNRLSPSSFGPSTSAAPMTDDIPSRLKSAETVSAIPAPIHSSVRSPETFANGKTATPAAASETPPGRPSPAEGTDCAQTVTDTMAIARYTVRTNGTNGTIISGRSGMWSRDESAGKSIAKKCCPIFSCPPHPVNSYRRRLRCEQCPSVTVASADQDPAAQEASLVAGLVATATQPRMVYQRGPVDTPEQQSIIVIQVAVSRRGA